MPLGAASRLKPTFRSVPPPTHLPACEPGLSVETQMVTSDFVQNENKKMKQTNKKKKLVVFA